MPSKKRVFHKNDYQHGDGMLTKVWGPSLWHTMHVISFNYPINPTEEDKKHYRDFILGLRFILPCKHCRNNLNKNFETLPLKMEHMQSRQTFSHYIYSLHELVNKMLGKHSGLTFCDVRERYEHFRARCSSKEITTHKKGCNEPLFGKKAKCLLRIVPDNYRAKTLKIHKDCLKKRKK
jgi:Erv1 / Alr family